MLYCIKGERDANWLELSWSVPYVYSTIVCVTAELLSLSLSVVHLHHDPASFMQSNVPLDVQEVDKSSAVVSYTPPETEVYINTTIVHAINVHTLM